MCSLVLVADLEAACVCVRVCVREKTMCMPHAFIEQEDKREEQGPFFYTHYEPIDF